MDRLRSIPYKWLVAAVFISGLFMDLLDTTVVNVALPTLGRHFSVGNTTLEWVITGYLLSLAVWIPASGWLGDRFGTKRIFLLALVLFTLASALCGLSWSIGSLIFFRVLQGVGGGMLTPVGTTMLYRAFPPDERAKASAVLVVPIAVAPTIGPILGGFLVDYLSWRWIFYVNLPIGILGIILAATVLREHKEASVGRFDLWGFLLAGAGLPLVLYALSQGPSAGWISARVLGTGLGGIALLVLLTIVELRVTEPMLALRLFGDRMFRNGNIIMFAVSAGLLGVLFLLPLFLQQLRGLSALQSGLTTFPQALGLIATARIASQLYPKVGPRRLVMVGLTGTAISTALFLSVDLDTSLWWIRTIMFLRGVAMAFALIPVQAATYATISPADTGRASSLFSTTRQVASSVGIAVLATVLAQRATAHLAGSAARTPESIRHAAVLGFHDSYLVAVLIAIVGVACAFLIHDEDAAASIVQAAPSPVQAEPATA